jgi:DNA invertase Pin-like site-specific DNA recombinase
MARKPRVAFYSRVSTKEQTTENQKQQLERICLTEEWDISKIECFEDTASGSKSRDERPGFDVLLKNASDGDYDIIAAWSIDRMGRKLQDLLELSTLAEKQGFTLYFYKDRVDTRTASGKFFFTIIGAVAEFERERIRERIHAGLDRAKAQGKAIGRPKRDNPELIEAVISLRQNNMAINKIAKQAGCSVGKVLSILNSHNNTGQNEPLP